METIVAIATPAGRGGVGVLRVSGKLVPSIIKELARKALKPRYATYTPFYTADAEVIDYGLALYFPGPNSFTGEDVLELQGHGGPVVLDCLLQSVLALGARLARPGEFSERAFLNDKIDLSQAEAIADLIDASNKQAVQGALNSLQGEFSKQINELIEVITELRIYVEATIDFPDEEIDFYQDGVLLGRIKNIEQKLAEILKTAKQGVLLKEGMQLVLVGKPNAGKSSILNGLAQQDIAIVTDIPGTTRDVLREHIHIDGMPLHIIDTAGIRSDVSDKIEAEGIRRTHAEIKKADHILVVLDACEKENLNHTIGSLLADLPKHIKKTLVINKIDLVQQKAELVKTADLDKVYLSAKTGQGLDLLKQHLKAVMGFENNTEGNIIARRRHLDALERAKVNAKAASELLEKQRALELVAEELRYAQDTLGEITGKISSDELLGKIFSSFCIGK